MTGKKILLIVLVLLLVISVSVVGTSIIRQTQFESSSQEFAVFITPLILSANPSAPQISDEETATETEKVEAERAWETYAHASLLQQQSNADRLKYLRIVAGNLGALEVIESIRGGSEVPIASFLGESQPTANYNLQVRFTRGAADVQISMLYEQDQWQITAFQVMSDRTVD